MAEIAEERGVPRAQIALAWVLAEPEVTAPIVGVTKPHHLDDAIAALDIELTDDEVARLEEPYVPAPGRRLQLSGAVSSVVRAKTLGFS